MAKKSRKMRAAAKPVAALQRPVANQSNSNAAPVQKTVKQATPASVNILQPGYYDYVKKDLITICILAGALILILIILNFVPALKA